MAKGRKTGGRKKGTPNKNKATLLEKLEECNFDVVAAIIESIAAMPEYMRVDPLIKMLEYMYPKRKVESLTLGGAIVTTGSQTLTKEAMIEVIRAARSGPTDSVE